MIQDHVALNTTFRERPDKQVTFKSTSGQGKQLDCVLIDRKEAGDLALTQRLMHDFHGKRPMRQKERLAEEKRAEERSSQKYSMHTSSCDNRNSRTLGKTPSNRRKISGT